MDTARLRDLVSAEGPFASVYFDDTHATEDAAKLLDLRWRELREELSAQGADRPILDALESAVRSGQPPAGRSGRALVAAGSTVLVDTELEAPPARPIARLSELPYLVPLAELGESPPAHVVAVVDRVGADVTAVDRDGHVVDARTVEGTDHHIHKVPSGGWAHRNFQEHTEELIKRNIELAAEHVADIARRIGAGLVVVAGETQARKALLEALPESVRAHASEVQGGGRHQGAGEEELDRQIRDLLSRAQQERRDRTAERFRAALAQPTGLAVQGLEATTTALREHNVETLLVDRPAEVEVLAGGNPTLLGMQEEELKAHGVEAIDRRRADEAVAVAAIAVNADIVHTGDRLDLTEGFGAILRHD